MKNLHANLEDAVRSSIAIQTATSHDQVAGLTLAIGEIASREGEELSDTIERVGALLYVQAEIISTLTRLLARQLDLDPVEVLQNFATRFAAER